MKNFLYLLPFVIFFILTSCGKDPGTKVTVKVEDVLGQQNLPLAVAYQIEDGEWAWLQPDENAGYSFYVPPGKERYGVAVRCGGFSSSITYVKRATIYQLATSDTTEPVFICPQDRKQYVYMNVTHDVSAIAGANGAAVYHRRSYSLLRGTSFTTNRPFFHTLQADVMFTAYSSSPANILAARLVKGVDLEDGASLNFTLDNNDLVVSANVAPFSLPAGWSGEYSVGIATKGELINWEALGRGNESGGSYSRIKGVDGNDYYLFSAWASRSISSNRALSIRYARSLAASTAGDLEAHFPDPFPDTFAPGETGGRWAFGLDYPEETSGIYLTYSFNDTRAYVWASATWLQGKSSYSLPDISAATGFATFDLPATGRWGFCALSGSAAFGELLELSRLDNRPMPARMSTPVEIGYSCAYGASP